MDELLAFKYYTLLMLKYNIPNFDLYYKSLHTVFQGQVQFILS